MTNKWNANLFMTREQIRAYDQIAIDKLGIPAVVLMENAGREATKVILSTLRDTPGKVAVLAGAGNNGGDGFVVARHLINSGIDVTVFLAANEEKLQGDALANFNLLKKMNADIEDIARITALIDLKSVLQEAVLIVDALLGTGITRPIEGHLEDIIEIVNDTGVPVISLDLPSGLDADKGIPVGAAAQDGESVVIRATETVTFGHYKTGLLLYPGVRLAGRTHVAPIGVPGTVSLQAGYQGELLCEERVRALISPRAMQTHKGNFGHLVVLAGSLGKSGAAVLASQAAMRVGTGLVTIATTSNAQAVIEPRLLEVMVESIIEKADAALTDKVIKRVVTIMEGKQAVALGPGLSTSPGISALVMRFLQSIDVPAIIDADGINILAADPSGAGRIKTPMVFTPHPGEMARLTNKTVEEVQLDRIAIASKIADWYKAVIVLKGAHSIIAAPDGRVFINPTGNPGMASAGSGDVLTGMIGGFLAQGLSPLNASLLGTYMHGKAGDLAAGNHSFAGLIASDIIDALPTIFKLWAL